MEPDRDSGDGRDALQGPDTAGGSAPGDGTSGDDPTAGLESEGAGLDADGIPGDDDAAELEVTEDGNVKRRVLFISDKEMQASEGDIDISPRQNRKGDPGALLTVRQGTVAGWLFLKLRELQMENQSLHGQMFAAGLVVQRLRETLAKQRGGAGGLLVPNDAEASGLVIPK